MTTAKELLELVEELTVDEIEEVDEKDYNDIADEDVVEEINGDEFEVDEKMARKKTVGGKTVTLGSLDMKRKQVRSMLNKKKRPGQKIVFKKGTAQGKLVTMSGAERAGARKAGIRMHKGGAVAKAARSRRKTIA